MVAQVVFPGLNATWSEVLCVTRPAASESEMQRFHAHPVLWTIYCGGKNVLSGRPAICRYATCCSQSNAPEYNLIWDPHQDNITLSGFDLSKLMRAAAAEFHEATSDEHPEEVIEEEINSFFWSATEGGSLNIMYIFEEAGHPFWNVAPGDPENLTDFVPAQCLASNVLENVVIVERQP